MTAGSATGGDLMERAGAAVARAARSGREAGRAIVLCGPGNNGGDGFVAARLLAESGWAVEVHAWGEADRAPSDAAAARAAWERIGATRPFAALSEAAPGADVMIDALFGTGVARPLPDAVLGAWDALEAREGLAPWKASLGVDGPSGLDLDTGRPRGRVRAVDRTVTFHAAKRGHVLGEGPELCGALTVADIGLPPTAAAVRLGAADPAALRKPTQAHKYDHGHALVLAGGTARGGAARLAARAALRVGAGLVTLGAPGPAMAENAARFDALMLRRIDDAGELREALQDSRINALLLGPGLGVERARALIEAALTAGRALTLDADALTALAGDASAVAAIDDPGRVTLTPHPGEFRSLFPDLADEAERGDRIAAVEAAAAASGATVLLKGPATVIAAPGAQTVVCAAVYDRAAPWLATAGSGDVLAGLICGLTARGFDAARAAEQSAVMHQAAGLALGAGLIAEDLHAAIPGVLKAWGV